MKKYPKFALSILFLATILVFNACGEDEEPANVIEDSDGITVDLDWTTGGSAAQSLDDVDLDLRVYKGDVSVLSSTSSSAFERVTLDPDNVNLTDGTYVVVVNVWDIDADVSYTVTINGVSVSKPYDFNSTFDVESDVTAVNTVNIVKKGNKYTISPAPVE